jgi:hypothetical protein
VPVNLTAILARTYADQKVTAKKREKLKKASTPTGKLDDKVENEKVEARPVVQGVVFEPFPDNTNPETGEINGPRGPEPTRYGDWERKGRVSDF